MDIQPNLPKLVRMQTQQSQSIIDKTQQAIQEKGRLDVKAHRIWFIVQAALCIPSST